MFAFSNVAPQSENSLGVLGYLIVLNNQIHNYQLIIVNRYLGSVGLKLDNTILANILDGKDAVISLQTAIDAFSGESAQVKADLLYVLYACAYVDGDCTDDERKFVARCRIRSSIGSTELDAIEKQAQAEAETIQNENNAIFQRPQFTAPDNRSLFQKIVDFILRLFVRLVALFTRKPESTEKSEDSEAYISAIHKCEKIAKEDYGIIRPVYDELVSASAEAANSLNRVKTFLASHSAISEQVSEIITALSDHINNNILLQEKTARATLLQKERALSDFTISLLGRTKAGKTTLHSILTGEGYDKIGVGMQRTTRYNRVFQWNMLRIIDTPGIGSAEANGRTDDEIAEGVMGESDVICFVVVDDSIQKDQLDFFEKAASLNKPIIILLNHKYNIRDRVRFENFLKKPSNWLDTTGEASLQGHINRIKHYANDHGFGSLISVYPVFLLAAQMAQEDAYKDYAKVLWENSNIDLFINQLKEWISASGTLKRSETLLDGTIQNFTSAARSIDAVVIPLHGTMRDMLQTRPEIIGALKSEQRLLVRELESFLREQFEKLKTQDALYFAEAHYSDKGDLSGKWDEYLEEIEFESRIQNKLHSINECFRKKLESTVSETFEDLYFSIKLAVDLSSSSSGLSFDLRSTSRILGGLLGLGSTIGLIFGLAPPVAIVLTVVGIIFEIAASLFKSKEQRRKEATDKLYNDICAQIDESCPQFIDSTVAQVSNNMDGIINNVNKLFTDLISGLETSLSIGRNLSKSYENSANQLSKVYAWRILTFLEHVRTSYSAESIQIYVSDVKRIEGHIMQIYTKRDYPYDTSCLSNVIADRVDIIKIGE